MWAWMQSRLVDYLATTDYADMDKIIATGYSRGDKVALCEAIYDERFAPCAPSRSGCGGVGCFRFLDGRMRHGTSVRNRGQHQRFLPLLGGATPLATSACGRKPTAATPPLCSSLTPCSNPLTEPDWTSWVTKPVCRLICTPSRCLSPRALISTDALADTWANPYGTQVTWRALAELVHDPSALYLAQPDGGAEAQGIRVRWDNCHKDASQAIFYYAV